MNNDFSFRIHIVRSARTTLEIDLQTQEFEDKQDNRIIALSSLEQDTSSQSHSPLKFLSDPFAMALGDLILRHAFPASDLPLQRSPQEGKMPVSFDPVKLRFDVQ
jgi:hypothetical protein